MSTLDGIKRNEAEFFEQWKEQLQQNLPTFWGGFQK